MAAIHICVFPHFEKDGQCMPGDQSFLIFFFLIPEAKDTNGIIWGLPMEAVSYPVTLAPNQLEICINIFLFLPLECGTAAKSGRWSATLKSLMQRYRRLLSNSCSLWKPYHNAFRMRTPHNVRDVYSEGCCCQYWVTWNSDHGENCWDCTARGKVPKKTPLD